jgi:hypothetical protein
MLRWTRSVATPLFLAFLMLGACESQDSTGLQIERGALTDSSTGELIAFGGAVALCVAREGNNAAQTVSCVAGGANDAFDVVGRTIALHSDRTLCLNVQSLNTGATAGVVNFAACDGSLGQQWDIVGGQIASANKSDGQQHCLDVQNGVEVEGQPVDLWSCNQTPAQTFWASGFSMTVVSSLVDGSTRRLRSECLENDTGQQNSTLNNNDCLYAGSSQDFMLDFQGHIALTSNPGLVLGLTLPVINGVTSVTLQPLTPTDATQNWTFVAQNPGNGFGGIVSIQNRGANLCLDVKSGSSAAGTLIDATTCNGKAQQRWQPIVGTPLFLVNSGGPVLSPDIFQIYFGSWWQLNQTGQEMRNISEDYVTRISGFLNGEGALAGQVPFVRQYGVMGATVGTPLGTPALGNRSILVPDTLTRAQFLISSGSIVLTTPPTTTATLTVNNFTFDGSFVGGTVTLLNAAGSTNNKAFVIQTFVSAHVVTIAPTVFDRDPADGDLAAGNPQAETFSPNSVQATISKAGLLNDDNIRSIVSNARAAGQIPSTDANALVMVFPSVDFTPNSCGEDKSDAPPNHDGNCQNSVHGAYHNAIRASGGFPDLAYGVVFEREAEPVSRREGGVSHEMFEASTDKLFGVAGFEAFIRGDGEEICDLCPNVLQPNSALHVNNIDLSSGVDNTLGGLCTSTGYVFVP